MRRFVLLTAWIVALPVAAGADEPTPEAVLADLPFLEYPEPHRVVVDLAPEGSRPLRFIVDTGASHNVATPRAAKELGINVRRHKRDPYRRKTLLGRDVHVLVDTRSSDTASRTGWEYALLGGQFLAEYVVEFDFAQRRMRLLHRKRYEVPERTEAPDELVLPLSMRSNRPGVKLEIEGKPTLLLLDSGAPPPVVLSGKVAEAVGMDPTRGPAFESRGVLGSTMAELRWIKSLAIGRFTFTGVPAVVHPKGFYNQAMQNDSLIGYELLSMFTVRLDYPRRRLWLKQRPDAELTFAGHRFDGLDDLLEKLSAPPPSNDAG